MDTRWCACGESFDGDDELRSHTTRLPRARHHPSPAVAQAAPVLPGGVLRALMDTTDDRRVTAHVVAEKVKRYRCGCWGASAQRPGPDTGPLSCRRVELFIQGDKCSLLHDGWDASGPRPEPPAVVRRGPAPRLADLAAELASFRHYLPAENSQDGTCLRCAFPVPAHHGLVALADQDGAVYLAHLHRGCAAEIRLEQEARRAGERFAGRAGRVPAATACAGEDRGLSDLEADV